jgi:hypothetical protein
MHLRVLINTAYAAVTAMQLPQHATPRRHTVLAAAASAVQPAPPKSTPLRTQPYCRNQQC